MWLSEEVLHRELRKDKKWKAKEKRKDTPIWMHSSIE